MGEFSVRLDLMKNSAEEEKIFTGELNGIETQIEDVRSRLRWKISAEAGIRERLGRLYSDIERWKNAMNSVQFKLAQSVIKYETTEKRLLGNNNEAVIGEETSGLGVLGGVGQLNPIDACKTLYEGLKDGYEMLKGTINDAMYSSGQFVDNAVHKIDELMEFLNSHIQEMREWLDEAIACDGVVLIGTGISFGAAANVSLGLQLAIDANGNMYYQVAPGAGVKAGADVSGDISIGLLPGKTCEDTEGFGVAVGASGGEGIIVGGDVLLAGEGDDMEVVGGQVSVGVGAEATGVEGHANMSNTITLYKTNIIAKDWDSIYNAWSKTQNVWEEVYH